MFKCLECGRKLKTVKAAKRASYHGCPRCGGVDIDLDTGAPRPTMTDAEKKAADYYYTRATK